MSSGLKFEVAGGAVWQVLRGEGWGQASFVALPETRKKNTCASSTVLNYGFAAVMKDEVLDQEQTQQRPEDQTRVRVP